MAELALRAAAVDDAAAIADLCNRISGELHGQADVDPEAVRGWFDLSDIAMFVTVRGRELAGYADVRREETGDRFPVDLRVQPGDAGDGAADLLLTAVEDWAGGRAEPGARLRTHISERDARSRAVLGRRGYDLIRHSFVMEIELADQLEQPDWPPGLALRTYDPGRDEQAVFDCTHDAFADHWEFRPVSLETWRTYTTADARFDPELWWLVEDGDELAAVCLNAWHFSGDPTFGWVGTLGVRRPWRRRGLGLALLQHSFLDFKRRGAVRVGLSVDAENTTGAVRLYERAGMHPVRRNDTYDRAVLG
jgi:mycothiol synthase